MTRPRTRRRTAAIATVVATVAVAGIATVALGSDETGPGRDAGPDLAVAPGVVVLSSAGVVTRPDGTTVDTGDSTHGQVTALPDGRVVMVGYPDGVTRAEVRVYEGDATLTATYVAGPELVHLDREAAAWVEVDGRLRVLADGVPEPLVLPAPPSRVVRNGDDQGFEIVGVDCTGTPVACAVTVAYRTVPPALRHDARGAAVLRMTQDGPEVQDLPEILRHRTDVSSDGATWAYDEISPTTSCIGLYDVVADRVSARSCDVDPAFQKPRLAPDGEHVITVNGFAPDTQVQVLDRDLTAVGAIEMPEGVVITSYAWADDDSLVLVVMDEDPVVAPTPQGEEETGGRYTYRILDQPIDGSEPTVLAGPSEGGSYDEAPRWVLGPAR